MIKSNKDKKSILASQNRRECTRIDDTQSHTVITNQHLVFFHLILYTNYLKTVFWVIDCDFGSRHFFLAIVYV